MTDVQKLSSWYHLYCSGVFAFACACVRVLTCVVSICEALHECMYKCTYSRICIHMHIY